MTALGGPNPEAFSSLVRALKSLTPEEKNFKVPKAENTAASKTKSEKVEIGKIDLKKDGTFSFVTKKPNADLSNVVKKIKETVTTFDITKASSDDLIEIQKGCEILKIKVIEGSNGFFNSILIMIMDGLGFTPSSYKTKMTLDSITDYIERNVKKTELRESIDRDNTELKKLQDQLARLSTRETAKEFVQSKKEQVTEKFDKVAGIVKGLAKKITGDSSKDVSPEIAAPSAQIALPGKSSLQAQIKELEKSIAEKNIALQLLENPINAKQTLRFKRAVLFGVGLGQRKTLKSVLNQLKLDPTILEKRAGMKESDTLGSNLSSNISYLKDLNVQIPNKEAQKIVQETLIRSEEVLNSGKQKGSSFGKAILQELNKMKTGEFLFVPMGCSNHDTLMTFTKLADGSIAIKYYNTGFGSEYMPQSGISLILNDCTGVKFDPIPLNSSTQASLLTLLTNMHAKESDKDMTASNQLLFGEKCVLQNAKQVTNNRNQKDGTCSFNSLLLGIEDVIKTKIQSEEAMQSFEEDLHFRVAADVAASLDFEFNKPRKNPIRERENLVTEMLLDVHNDEFLKSKIDPPKPKYRVPGTTALKDFNDQVAKLER